MYEDLNNQIMGHIQGRQGQRQVKSLQLRKDLGADDQITNLNNIRNSVLDTEKLLTSLPKNINQRTSGRMVTQAQRDRLTAKEREPIAGTLGNLARQENVASTGLDRILGDVDSRLSMDDTDFNTMLDELRSRREMSFQDKMAKDAAKAAQDSAIDWDKILGGEKEEDFYVDEPTSVGKSVRNVKRNMGSPLGDAVMKGAGLGVLGPLGIPLHMYGLSKNKAFAKASGFMVANPKRTLKAMPGAINKLLENKKWR